MNETFLHENNQTESIFLLKKITISDSSPSLRTAQCFMVSMLCKGIQSRTWIIFYNVQILRDCYQ